MAFANLFTSLAAVDEDVKSPGQPAFTHTYVVLPDLVINHQLWCVREELNINSIYSFKNDFVLQ